MPKRKPQGDKHRLTAKKRQGGAYPKKYQAKRTRRAGIFAGLRLKRYRCPTL